MAISKPLKIATNPIFTDKPVLKHKMRFFYNAPGKLYEFLLPFLDETFLSYLPKTILPADV